MNNLTTSFLLLLVAIVLLWLAVTDKLSRVLDAYDVLTGKEVSSGAGNTLTSAAGKISGAINQVATFQLPSLPAIGDPHHVGI